MVKSMIESVLNLETAGGRLLRTGGGEPDPEALVLGRVDAGLSVTGRPTSPGARLSGGCIS